jgi:hypothetical protein
MKLLTRKLMQFLPLSNDHYHTYLTTVWLISWTLEVKTKLLSKQKHYNAHNVNASIQLQAWCIKRFKCIRHINLKYVLHSKLQKHDKDLWLWTTSFFTSFLLHTLFLITSPMRQAVPQSFTVFRWQPRKYITVTSNIKSINKQKWWS